MTLIVYNMIWRLIRPFVPLILWQRTRNGKELAKGGLSATGVLTQTSINHPTFWSAHLVAWGQRCETVAALRLARALADHCLIMNF